ncbi:MAG: prepilin-type N-terminal cleavage/methylation domain-containing protein [Chthoniobacterales bacterium]
MFIVPASRKSRTPRCGRDGYKAGFTLLEITLAAAILATMSLAIYRFVQANVTGMRFSAEQTAADARYTGLVNMLTAQWQSLPPGVGALLGEPFKLSDMPRDEITWVCSAGPGLLTRYASGDFVVTLRMRESKTVRNTYDLGVTRQAAEETGGESPGSWLPLIENIRGIQIRYFDPRLNSWVERWTDTSTLPRLVKLDIARPDLSVPWEVIIPLGRTPL